MGRNKRKPSKLKSLKRKLESKAFSVFIDNPESVFNYKQVSDKLSEKDNQIRLVIAEALVKLCNGGKLKEMEKGKYKLAKQKGRLYEGVIDISSRGVGFFCSEELESDIKINNKELNHALKGDLVKVKLINHNGRVKAKILEILDRPKKTYSGIIEINDKYSFFISDDKSLYIDVFIPKHKIMDAPNGAKVAVVIDDWPETAKSPFGRVIEVLGMPGDHNAEINALLYEFDLDNNFPDEVLEASEKISTKIVPEDLKERKDLRGTTTFTIDPHDAKDFDDAISVKKLKGNLWEIGVHIADVSHYVTEGSTIDKEAVKRATSVYLVNKVVPMLPEVLSNNLCSLRPNEDKLCFSAVFQITEEAVVKDYWIGRTIIHSNKRFTYENAQDVLDNGDGELHSELKVLDDIAKKLRKERFKHGGFEFGSTELKFEFNDEGEPVKITEKKLQDTNRLVEDFMLLANKYVAIFVNKIKPTPPFIYRIHDLPDPEKLSTLMRFVSNLGIQFNPDPNLATSEINKLLASVKDKPEEDLINQMAVRTMSKAEYSTDNIGHYGLGFEFYSHFTSPIRRYPDVIAHRLLWKYIHNKMKGVRSSDIQVLASHSSKKERKAIEAERASTKYMQAFYIQRFIGEEFGGTISGVTRWGMYVSMDDNKCEGMIPLKSMKGDNYAFSEEKMAIVGVRKRTEYKLGSRVRVKVISSDVMSREIDLELVGN